MSRAGAFWSRLCECDFCGGGYDEFENGGCCNCDDFVEWLGDYLCSCQCAQKVPDFDDGDDTYQACHYCRGTGRMHRTEATSELIAVPVSDSRLRPRRTKLIVAVSAVFTALLGAIIVYFLLPRQILLSLESNITTEHAFIPTQEQLLNGSHVNVTFKQNITLRNSNYVGATVRGLQFTVYYHQYPAGLAVFPDVHIRSKSSVMVELTVHADHIEEQYEPIALRQCTFFPQQDKMEFKINGTGLVLSQGQQLYHFVSVFANCRNSTT
eukprot:comp17889_c1_seq1/m.18127 comp17889_c1_seq1/g.18127  ORF comp17889_c1_seq1/g.18127 comp17889_c1_seq1/m.18127 type:complete len:267 (-) comp17889_c1_seq1:78-878(-)